MASLEPPDLATVVSPTTFDFDFTSLDSNLAFDLTSTLPSSTSLSGSFFDDDFPYHYITKPAETLVMDFPLSYF